MMTVSRIVECDVFLCLANSSIKKEADELTGLNCCCVERRPSIAAAFLMGAAAIGCVDHEVRCFDYSRALPFQL